MNKHKQVAIKALRKSKSDDLYRAKHYFKGYTDKQMNEPYGYSEKTPNQMLVEYEAHEKSIDEAIAWLVSLNE
jgi:hypothetical protein